MMASNSALLKGRVANTNAAAAVTVTEISANSLLGALAAPRPEGLRAAPMLAEG